MPQLVKGGKYVYGWTIIKKDGQIHIPDEAFNDYNFKIGENIILMSGSKTSGGFGINTPEAIQASKIGQHIIDTIGYLKESRSFTTHRLDIIRSGTRFISWTRCDEEKSFCLSNELIDLLGLKIGSKLLVVRGSGLGPGFIAKGPIFNEALKHKYLSEHY